MEDARKILLLGDLLQRRAGIGDGNKMRACLILADGVANLREEIILHHIRLGGAAGFAGDDQQ